MKTYFKHNGQIIHSIDNDLYVTEMEQLIKHIAYTIEAEPEEIELCYEVIEDKEMADLSNLAVTSDGHFIFDIGNEFGVNFMENKPIKGIRLTCDLKLDGVLERFLDRIIDNKADENLEFTI